MPAQQKRSARDRVGNWRQSWEVEPLNWHPSWSIIFVIHHGSSFPTPRLLQASWVFSPSERKIGPQNWKGTSLCMRLLTFQCRCWYSYSAYINLSVNQLLQIFHFGMQHVICISRNSRPKHVGLRPRRSSAVSLKGTHTPGKFQPIHYLQLYVHVCLVGELVWWGQW